MMIHLIDVASKKDKPETCAFIEQIIKNCNILIVQLSDE